MRQRRSSRTAPPLRRWRNERRPRYHRTRERDVRRGSDRRTRGSDRRPLHRDRQERRTRCSRGSPSQGSPADVRHARAQARGSLRPREARAMSTFKRQADVLQVTDEQALEGWFYFHRVREEKASKYPDYVKARQAASATV